MRIVSSVKGGFVSSRTGTVSSVPRFRKFGGPSRQSRPNGFRGGPHAVVPGFPLVLRASPYWRPKNRAVAPGGRGRGLDWPAFRPLCRDFESLILHYPRKVGGAPLPIILREGGAELTIALFSGFRRFRGARVFTLRSDFAGRAAGRRVRAGRRDRGGIDRRHRLGG